jgi:hypothetical protein
MIFVTVGCLLCFFKVHFLRSSSFPGSGSSVPSSDVSELRYEQRTNAGALALSFNTHLRPDFGQIPAAPSSYPGAEFAASTLPAPQAGSRCRVVPLAGSVAKQYRYMYTPIVERSANLERRMVSMQDVFASMCVCENGRGHGRECGRGRC